MADGGRSLGAEESLDIGRVAAIYRAHASFVWRVLRRCGIPEADLDDAVQEVFLVVFRRLGEFESRAAEQTWLYAIATRVASTLRRGARREQHRRDVAGAQMHSLGPIDPEDAVARGRALCLVHELLDELDEPKRTVFVLAELEGVRVPEISRILGVNPRTVHSRLRLARERFDAALHRRDARVQGRILRRRLAVASRAQTGQMPDRRATWAALLPKLQTGTAPIVAGWESLAIPAATTPSVAIPFVATLAAGAGLIVAVDAALPSASPSPPPITVSTASAPVIDDPEQSPVLTSTTPRAPQVEPQPQAAATTSAPAPAPRRRRAASTASAADMLAAETTLLERARASLRTGDTTTALAALEEHQRAFPRGSLARERNASIVKALCAAGRDAEAQAFAHAPGRAAELRGIVVTACS